MRLTPSVVGVVLVAVFGTVQATPGILDLFNFETKFGPPPVRTVYVVKPSHGHGHEPTHSHGRTPKTIIKYVSKPPSSSHSISPFSIFSNPFSSGGGSGGWSTLSHGPSSSPSGRGKGKKQYKPISLMVDDEVTDHGSDAENSLGGHMGDDVMFTSTRGNSDFDSQDPNADVEVASRPQSMRGMRPPTTSSAAVMTSQGQGGYDDAFEEPQSKPLRLQSGRSRPRPASRRPTSSMVMMSAGPNDERPSTFDDDESSNDVQSGFDEDADVSMSPVSVTSSSSSTKTSRPGSSKKHRGSSSSAGWSSGPKTITYITHGWGGPSSSGWGAWGDSSSNSFPSSFVEDDYWPIGGGGWSSSSSGSGVSSGWSSSSSGSGGGWRPGGPPSIGGETGTDHEETSEPEAPVEVVDEVGTTEEGEDRRPTTRGRGPQKSTPGRRPASSSGLGTRTAGTTGRHPSSAFSSSGTSSNRPSSISSGPSRPRPTSGRNVPFTSPVQAQQPARQKRPRTNEPQPEYLDLGSGSQSQTPEYGVPGSQSGSVAGRSNGQLMIGGQTISNQDGLLDDELIRTVQQIIQTFDKN